MSSVTSSSVLKKILFGSLFLCFTFALLNTQAHANPLSERLRGRILIQVEKNGEAWYVNPADEKKYFMGRPVDAFDLMRRLGVGITNIDLAKIEIANENLSGLDSDGDGLSDLVEDAIGTNKNKVDTDDDGHNDKSELIAGYNPSGAGKINKDSGFASKQTGRILLQVEQNGEAWYIYPGDDKRYYLGRPRDAFSIMRKLGLGITDSDLATINGNDSSNPTEWLGEITCPLLADKLDDCSEYKCQFKHPDTGDMLNREIYGFNKAGECVYLEELLDNNKAICKYQEQQRKEVVKYYREEDTIHSSFLMNTELSEYGQGIEPALINTPLNNALNNNQCSIGFIPSDVNISDILKSST